MVTSSKVEKNLLTNQAFTCTDYLVEHAVNRQATGSVLTKL